MNDTTPNPEINPLEGWILKKLESTMTYALLGAGFVALITNDKWTMIACVVTALFIPDTAIKSAKDWTVGKVKYWFEHN